MRGKYIFLFILFIYCTKSYSQNQVDSVRALSALFEFDLQKIDSLNIKNVKQTIYLPKNEKQKKGLNQNIHSEIIEYSYKSRNLIKESRYYSGVDKNGKDHFNKKTIGFNTYSMIFENYYVYDKNDSLIRIDQNTPFRYNHSNFMDLKELKSNQFIIDKLPIDQFLLINFDTEAEYILWQITKNRYLYFKIIQ